MKLNFFSLIIAASLEWFESINKNRGMFSPKDCQKQQFPLLVSSKLNSKKNIHYSFCSGKCIEINICIKELRWCVWPQDHNANLFSNARVFGVVFFFFGIICTKTVYKKIQYEQIYKIEQEIWTDFIQFKSVHELLTHCYGFSFYTCSSWNK